MKFDVVVANPPFSLDKWGAEHAGRGPVQALLARHPAQVQGRLRLHHPHGRDRPAARPAASAVIVPHGVLFRGGSEGDIRQTLIEENLLDAVIGLPANLFTSTGIPVAILVFDRSREAGRRERGAQGRALHRREPRVHAGQDAERPGRGAHRQDPRDLPRRAAEVDEILPPGQPQRRSPRTTSTSTSRATSTPSSQRRRSTSPPCRRRSTASRPSSPRCALAWRAICGS